ncbi:MAG: HAD hydrolase family protein [Candidatus Omnitrophota bacterium]|nr:MAG: HAD hydrolase family protein [Candidatus Omnitrophota bacterium]
MSIGKQNKMKTLFKKVKLLILDVDGVLTRGEIIYDDRDRELKIFNVKDGLGIFLLRRLGIKTILLSAKNSPVLARRARDMRVEEVMGNIIPKERALEGIKRKYKVAEDEICFVGDDLIDLELIKRVGVGVAVKGAPLAVRRCAQYVTANGGGEGAVREVVELIITAKKLEKRLYRLLKELKPASRRKPSN